MRRNNNSKDGIDAIVFVWVAFALYALALSILPEKAEYPPQPRFKPEMP